jgi:uncharacterized protein (TIGR00725 family)
VTQRPAADDEELERELRSLYLENGDERASALEALHAACAAAPGDAHAAHELRRALHRLGTSAGSLGLGGLSDAAKALERSLRGAALPLDRSLLDAVATLAGQMRASFSEAARPPAPPPAALSEARRRLVIAVLGDGTPGADGPARQVGAQLARAGTHLLVARAAGTPAEAARGFREARGAGLVLALLAGEHRAAAPPWVDLPLPTGLGPAQAALLPLCADGAIAIGGGAAALAELSHFLHQGKPVATLQGSGGAATLAVGCSLGGEEPVPAADATDAVHSLLRALAALEAEALR